MRRSTTQHQEGIRDIGTTAATEPLGCRPGKGAKPCSRGTEPMSGLRGLEPACRPNRGVGPSASSSVQRACHSLFITLGEVRTPRPCDVEQALIMILPEKPCPADPEDVLAHITGTPALVMADRPATATTDRRGRFISLAPAIPRPASRVKVHKREP